jgi:hypothetical protein
MNEFEFSPPVLEWLHGIVDEVVYDPSTLPPQILGGCRLMHDTR